MKVTLKTKKKIRECLKNTEEENDK